MRRRRRRFAAIYLRSKSVSGTIGLLFVIPGAIIDSIARFISGASDAIPRSIILTFAQPNRYTNQPTHDLSNADCAVRGFADDVESDERYRPRSRDRDVLGVGIAYIYSLFV